MGDSLLMTLLIHEECNMEILRLFISHGMDVNQRWITRHLKLKIFLGFFRIAHQCGKKGAVYAHFSSLPSATALHLAVQFGHVEAIHTLLDARADPFLEDRDGATALGRA